MRSDADCFALYEQIGGSGMYNIKPSDGLEIKHCYLQLG